LEARLQPAGGQRRGAAGKRTPRQAVPGRKTDVKDCEWLADLLAHGLIRGSFIPPAPIRELRELTRHRKILVRNRVDEVNRIQKLLETANIKLGSVVSDVLGVSGRAMLRALVAGERDPMVLAKLAKGSLIPKVNKLAESLHGRFTEHHAFLLGQLLRHIEHLDESISLCDERITDVSRPYAAELERLQTIPGIKERASQALIAQIGVDMSRFPTAGHLASWARICPDGRWR
jgi:transposase